MADLDDAPALRAGDPSGLLDAFLSTGPELRRSYDAARSVPLERWEPRSITFCAMGGSAAAADLAAVLVEGDARVPASVVRDRRLPGYCGPRDLVACISHSGATEEVLDAFRAAAERGCRMVALSAGGELEAAATQGRVPHVPLRDAPMPRAAVGALTGSILGALEASGILEVEGGVTEASTELAALAEELEPAVPEEKNPAKQVASWLGDRVPVIWGSGAAGAAAAFRWKAAFNENAEVPAFASILPELTHHEVVGWGPGRGEGFRVIALRHQGDDGALVDRVLAELEPAGPPARQVRARGSGPLAEALSLMVLGDLASSYHALAREIDPGPIEAIDRLKRRGGR
jgi:glucose/mannose-6-phosphate isomerase